MSNKMSYELELEIKEKYTRFSAFKNEARFYTPVFYELMANADECFRAYYFTKLKICLKRMKGELNNDTSYDGYYRREKALVLINELDQFSDKMIENGFDQVDDKDVELTEKENLRINKQKINSRLKEIQEINAPYLNMSLAVSCIIIAIIFFFMPAFLGAVANYHICSFMLVVGLVLLFNERNIRKSKSIGWFGYSDKITSKRAFLFLVQAPFYMVSLILLYLFFSQILFIRILFFIQIWVCSVIMINGIALLIACNVLKQKERKFNVGSFISGAITVAGFIIQILQLFKVL